MELDNVTHEAWFPIFNGIDPMMQAALDQWPGAEALAVHAGAPGR